jgi:hypothetical protein
VFLVFEATSAVTFAKNASTSVPLWADIPHNLNGHDHQYSWFERHSRINVRDMPVIERLDQVITRISAGQTEPVLILSGQMGMVPYHIARRHFGRVRFLDRHGLVERTLTGCSIARELPKDSGGIETALDWYFRHLAELERTCGMRKPDVVFDLGRNTLNAYGYEDVYTQSGTLASSGTWLSGDTVLLDMFIAVKPHLALSYVSPSGVRIGG